MSKSLLTIDDVSKSYGTHVALDHVSLNVEEGTVHGLLGPNGAGKTTLIRIINHIIYPDGGRVLLDGSDITANDVRHLGYLPEERGLYKKMKVMDHIVFLGRLKGMSRNDAYTEGRRWLSRMGLDEWANKKIEALSKGMAQKVQFIGTVLHRPRLLIFDEPFSGFDPVNADQLRDEILELNRQGSTILFSTHNMASVEEVCRNITMIDRSKVVLDGTVGSVKEQHKKRLWRVSVAPGEVVSSADGLFEVTDMRMDADGDLTAEATIRLAPEADFRNAVDMLNRQYTLKGFEEILPSMHEVFVETVKKGGINHE